MNKWIQISAVFIIMLLIQLPSALADSSTEGSSGTTPWVTGYYVGYQRDMLPPENIYWDGITHIAMGAATANADGTLNTGFYIDDTNGPALARQISTLAHAHNKKAILMLGGAGNGAAIHSAVSNHRAAFIANIVSAMDSLGYDGVDLDWEDDVDWALFETFAKELRLAAPGKIITLPGGAINSNYQTVDPLVVRVTKYVDQFNLMTYYPATAWAGDGWYSWHNSPLKGAKSTTPVSIEDSLARYNASGVPKEKMGMGVGFYAIGYKGGITGPNQPTTSGMIVGGDNAYPLSELYGTGGAYDEQYRHWDSDALEPYLSLPRPDSFGAKYISFEDEQSLKAKGAFTRENGYGGIIIWTINEGYIASRADPNFLMEALRAGFIEPPVTPPVVDLPGQIHLPTDPDKDGLYEDLNGNGRLDFADVTLFFGQMDWIAANEPVAAFDMNGNGRIDFNDIVMVFREAG
jgi:chitinase